MEDMTWPEITITVLFIVLGIIFVASCAAAIIEEVQKRRAERNTIYYVYSTRMETADEHRRHNNK